MGRDEKCQFRAQVLDRQFFMKGTAPCVRCMCGLKERKKDYICKIKDPCGACLKSNGDILEKSHGNI